MTDSRLLAQTVAATLGMRLPPRRTPLEGLVAAIGSREMLVVLDNCESLATGCAELCNAVGLGCPATTILATSRVPLGASREMVWSVPPLELPAPDAVLVEHVQHSPAAQLLVERIRAHHVQFRLTAQTAPAVAEICRRLDGLPLALELAAARVPQMGVNEVARRIDDRLRLLTLGRGAAPARHQTLRATLEFDQELLNDDERTLLWRLAVFVGGFDLAAAEAVGSGERLASDRVVDVLGALVTRALVLTRHVDGDVRYRQLETVREFALDQLRAVSEEAAARERHATFYWALARQQPRIHQLGPEAAATLARLDVEQHNLRAALRWFIDRRDVERALELALILAPWWAGRGYLGEGRATIAELLAMPAAAAPSSERAGLLVWSALLANFSGDWLKVRPLAEEALDVARAVGDSVHVAGALHQLAWNSLGHGDRARAGALFQEAADTSHTIGNVELEITSRVFLALLLLGSGQTAQATHEVQTALDLSRQYALAHEMGRIQLVLGLLALDRGDLAAARRRLEAAVQRLQSGANRFWEAAALTALGRVTADLGDARAARQALAAALQVGQSLGGHWPLLRSWLEACAVMASAAHQPTRALRLAAAASKLVPRPGAQPVVIQGLSAVWLAQVRMAAGAHAEASWNDGCDLPADDAIAEALKDNSAEPTPANEQETHSLTRREGDVVRLVARGHTNREIAERMSITEGTARVYVERAMAKLGVHSRAQLVVWALGRGLGATDGAG
ncbi:MAG: hypothetical protein JOZ81_05740 [Chloroflexi bacterium]|nr:hypothetical protein [Chloroflexota bacterium]